MFNEQAAFSYLKIFPKEGELEPDLAQMSRILKQRQDERHEDNKLKIPAGHYFHRNMESWG